MPHRDSVLHYTATAATNPGRGLINRVSSDILLALKAGELNAVPDRRIPPVPGHLVRCHRGTPPPLK